MDEIIALNKYDMQLKTVLYPKVMFIENALKSYVIEALLSHSKSENFDVIYNKSLTAYKNHTPGSKPSVFIKKAGGHLITVSTSSVILSAYSFTSMALSLFLYSV